MLLILVSDLVANSASLQNLDAESDHDTVFLYWHDILRGN